MSNKIIPYGRQHIDEQDIKAVEEVLKSDFLTQGPKVKEFEEEFAKYTGAKYAVAVTNGTAALHLANLALGTREGKKVITTPITFAATANSVLYCGAQVDFADIDPKTYLIDLNKIEDKIKKLPDDYAGIIPVDLAGYPVDLEALKEIADRYGLWIIEDACHAPGAYFTGRNGQKQMCGNGDLAQMSIFSFHPVKHIAAGEGGMITTNDKDLYQKLIMLRTHGITKSPGLLEENHGGWYYEMHQLGYNYRLSDIHAALGLSQLKKLNYSLERRNEIARQYDKAFKDIEQITIPYRAENIYHAFHLYIILAEDRKGLYDYLREHNVFAQVHYIPVHLQPYYKKLGWKKGDLPAAEAYYEKALSLPMYPTLSKDEQDYVIDLVKKFYNA